VADAGALSKAAPEYPLLHEGKVDVFKGIPGGVSPARVMLITIPVIGRRTSWLAGRWGRAKATRAGSSCWAAALDPIVELNVFVFAANGDFDSVPASV
jgi:S-DNA-T family DNA segregation ATPase FtsK/SpoIIIE